MLGISRNSSSMHSGGEYVQSTMLLTHANDCISLDSRLTKMWFLTRTSTGGGMTQLRNFAAVTVAAVLHASGANAQTAAADLQEIVVTAQKTAAQPLQEVPLAIQAFSGEELKEKNIRTISDLVSSVPGAFVGQSQSVASRSYNLRGAGGSNANGDSPIGYYLDDVPFIVTNFGIAPPVRFIDIERVEVLRGPQGTLYGQG